jgi:uncharacterized protein YndB with AHSA1/START domain
MAHEGFTTGFTVDRSPEQVYAAIMDVRAWWTGEIEGSADQHGAEFTYRYQDLHRSTQRVTELVPGKRVVWRVVEGRIGFVRDTTEWTGTEIIFDLAPVDGGTAVRFTHAGLLPTYECFDSCSNAWTHYVEQSLRDLILSPAVR